jgi:two-component system OmpR family response regulator
VEAAALNQQAPRILVASMDPTLGGDLCARLRQVGLEADLATDPAAARERVGRPCYVGFIVDVAQPRGTGYDLVAEIRRSGRTEPVLLLGTPSMAEDMAWVRRDLPGWEAADTGRGTALVEQFLRTLRHEVRDPARVLRYADIIVDRIEHRVCRGGEEIPLTPAEYGLLEQLVLSAEHVVEHEELRQALGADGQTSNSPAVHMVQLRRKLRGGRDEPELIRTLRGRGYMLKASANGSDDDATA